MVLNSLQFNSLKPTEALIHFMCAWTDVSACVSSVLRHGQAFSPIYRFSLSDGTIVSAHTKSKLVRSPATNEPQLYMSLHILQRYVSLPTPV